MGTAFQILQFTPSGSEKVEFYGSLTRRSHKITEWLRLEMTSGGHLIQQPLQAGHPDQGAQAHVQAAFDDLSGKKFHSLSGQPLPVLYHSQSTEVLPGVWSEPPVCHFVSIASCFVTGHHWKEPSSYFHSPGVYIDIFEIPLSLLQAREFQLSASQLSP